jgi:hypothetical protein
MEPASKLNAALTKGLLDIHDKLGNPTDCSVNTGWVMLDNIMQVWNKYYPREVREWKKDVLYSLETERSIAASVKAGGYFPMSYPARLHKMIKVLLPDQKLNDDIFIHQLLGRYPFLKTTNAKV